MNRNQTLLATTLTLVSLSTALAEPTAEDILGASRVQGGLAVHVGCGDGSLTANLHVGDRYLIHGLDTNPENVAKARRHIASRGLQGRVGADTFD